MSLKFRGLLTFAFAIVVANGALAAEAKRPNNLILFVADGLRALSVTADTAVCAENLDSDVLVMQPANQGIRHNASDPLNWARDRRILGQ